MTNMAQRLWVLPLDSATGLPPAGEPITDSMGLATTSDLSRDGSKLVYVLGRRALSGRISG